MDERIEQIRRLILANNLIDDPYGMDAEMLAQIAEIVGLTRVKDGRGLTTHFTEEPKGPHEQG